MLWPQPRPNMTAPHAAWAQLDEELAWRRAACRIAAACSADEAAKGSVLKFMQSSRFGSLLPRPKGSLNSYLDALPDLSAAIVSYVRQAGDAFYAQAPFENLNYGGRGAGQQLWWKASAQEWRVTQPDRLKLNPEGKPQSKRKQPARADDNAIIRDEDIHLLPPVEPDAAAPALSAWWAPWGGNPPGEPNRPPAMAPARAAPTGAWSETLSSDDWSEPDAATTSVGDVGDAGEWVNAGPQSDSTDEDGASPVGYPDRPEDSTVPAPWVAEGEGGGAPAYGHCGGDAGLAREAEPGRKRFRCAALILSLGIVLSLATVNSDRQIAGVALAFLRRGSSANLPTAFFFGLTVVAALHVSSFTPPDRDGMGTLHRALSTSNDSSLDLRTLEGAFVCTPDSSRTADLIPWAGWPEQCPLGILLLVRTFTPPLLPTSLRVLFVLTLRSKPAEACIRLSSEPP